MQNVYSLLFVENIMITIVVTYFFIVYRTSKPPTPPSQIATRNHDSITQGMWNDCKILMNNKNYMLILFIFSLIYSLYAGIGFVISPLLLAFDYIPF